MKTILISLLLFPSLSLADELKLLCKGGIKHLEDDPNSKEVITKVIGIQLYKEGMRLDGEWVLISEVSNSRFFGFCTAQYYEVKNNKKELKFVNFYSEDVRQHMMKLNVFF